MIFKHVGMFVSKEMALIWEEKTLKMHEYDLKLEINWECMYAVFFCSAMVVLSLFCFLYYPVYSISLGTMFILFTLNQCLACLLACNKYSVNICWMIFKNMYLLPSSDQFIVFFVRWTGSISFSHILDVCVHVLCVCQREALRITLRAFTLSHILSDFIFYFETG